MKEYKKPMVVYSENNRGIFPAIAGALALGMTMGLARGRNVIDSYHTQALTQRTEKMTARKNFSLE